MDVKANDGIVLIYVAQSQPNSQTGGNMDRKYTKFIAWLEHRL
jgi:hypothetical protein